jgi:hypothetical protein
MKGIIVFYINFFPEYKQSVDDTLTLVKNHNRDLIEKVKNSDYDVMFVPTTKEASRVEKIDFDKPFPRFVVPVPNTIKIEEDEEEEDK